MDPLERLIRSLQEAEDAANALRRANRISYWTHQEMSEGIAKAQGRLKAVQQPAGAD